MKITLRQLHANWLYLVFTPLYLISLAISFIINIDGSLFSHGALTSYLFLILIASLPGILMVFGGYIVRIIIATLILNSFLFFLYIDWLNSLNNHIGIIYIILLLSVIISILLYILRHNMAQFLCTIFIVFFIATLFTHREPFISKQEFKDVKNKLNKSLPPYIHIVLDEHIGIEGINESYNPNNELSKELKKKYIDEGFRVYGRAYSRYYHTVYSVASFLNFEPIDDFDGYIVKRKFANTLSRNLMFESLAKQGYQINVIQTSYLDLCNNAKAYSIVDCATYKQTALMSDDLAAAIIINGSMFNLGKIYKLIQHKLFIGSEFPYLNYKIPSHIFSSAIASYRVINGIDNIIKKFKHGNAYFFHLLLPHAPYVFDQECSLVSDTGKNIKAYEEQVKCTQKLISKFLNKLNDNPDFRNATIVIQSDHGSRVAEIFKRKKDDKGAIVWTYNDFLQAHSAFFAVKSGKYSAGYDRRVLPLDVLLKDIFLGVDNMAYEEGAAIYCYNSLDNDKLASIDLPIFYGI